MSATTAHNAIISSAQNNSAIFTEFGTEISKGFSEMEALSEKGKILRVLYISDVDIEEESEVGNTVMAEYSFLISFGFTDDDLSSAENRKTEYSKMLRTWIDDDYSFGGVCIGITKAGPIAIVTDTDNPNYFFGVMPLKCYINEVRGSR